MDARPVPQYDPGVTDTTDDESKFAERLEAVHDLPGPFTLKVVIENRPGVVDEVSAIVAVACDPP